VEHSDDDGGTHLDGVEEGETVGVEVPGGVSSERIDAVHAFVVATVLLVRLGISWLLGRESVSSVNGEPDPVHGGSNTSCVKRIFKFISSTDVVNLVRRINEVVVISHITRHVSFSHVVATTEPIMRDGEELVIEEAIVHGAHSHGEHEVASGEEDFSTSSLKLVGKKGEHEAGEEDEGSVTVITEHHSEEEGEGDDGEGCGVSFHVGGDTVHVGDHLEGGGHFVFLEVGGRV